MKKPLIGITPLFDDQKNSYWMIPGYMKGIMAAGGVPVILPLTADKEAMERMVEGLDGILITGGPDVDPRLYNEEVVMESGILTPFRDILETRLIKTLIEQDKPCFGICRGMQLMNVMMGGSLYQDLPSQHPQDCDHVYDTCRFDPCHEVDVAEGSLLAQWVGADVLGVNSLHHQAVKDLGEGLEVMAVSKGGDLIEAFCAPSLKFFCGVQWHPEHLFHKYDQHLNIFRAFVDACR